MKRILAVLMAAAFLSTSGLVAAQRIDTETSVGWVGDEPNTPSAGVNPNAWDGSPSANYPAEQNGLGPDRVTSSAPILAVNFVHNVPQSPNFDVNSAHSRLLGAFVTRGMMLPGMGQFQAYFGEFQDFNGNGWIDDANHNYDRAHVSTRGQCTTDLRQGDPNGLGETLPTGEATDTGLTLRCIGDPDEFVPGDGGTVIVAYVTPGTWGGGSDWVNRWVNPWNPLTPPADPAPETPDFQFKSIGVEGETTGRYFAPDTNFQYTPTDSSVLETITLEAISDAKTVNTGPRTQEKSATSLVEVDNYAAMDPTVAALYFETVTRPLGAAGCNPDFMERGCRDTTDPFTEPVRKETARSDTTVGPVVGQVVTKWEQNPNGLDYTDPHLFLDLFWDTSLAAGAVVSFNDNNIVAGVSPYSNAQLSPTADGSPHAWPQISIMGYFGVWQDLSGDGWIGQPQQSEGCGDAYNCGNKPWPHEYPQNVGGDGKGEFTVACGAREVQTNGANVAGAFFVTVTSSDNVWGGEGVYVLTDRRDVRNLNADVRRDDGRGIFIPYDDIAFDVADNQRVDALVTEGPVEMMMVCRNQNGFYYSYERLVFPGTNLDYDITVSGGTGGDFVNEGVPQDERVHDIDVITRVQ